jgi:F-type H+-transporting ATPase subunit delta
LIDKAIARRYAMALFHAANDNGQLDQVMSDYQLVLSFLKQDPRLGELLRHQRLSTRRKKEIVRELWQDRVARIFLSYMELLIDKRRERFLEEIYDLFASQVRQVHNIVVAEVRTAFPLEKQAELHLKGALEKLTGKQVELETSLHPELIGGLAVKIGDRIFDGSTTKRLQLLGRSLIRRSNGKLEVGT